MLVERSSPAPAYRGVVQTDRDDRRIFFDPNAVREWLGSRSAPADLSCDIESDGLGVDAYSVKCVTFSDGYTSAILDPRDPAQAATIALIFDHADTLDFHNSPFDVPVLAVNGLLTPDRHLGKVQDSLIWARMAAPDKMDRKSLDALASKHLGYGGDKIGEAMRAAGYANQADGYRGMDIDSFVWTSGAMADARATARLTPILRDEARRVIEAVAESAWRDWMTPDVEGLLYREQTVNRTMLAGSLPGLEFDRDYYDAWKVDADRVLEQTAEQLATYGLPAGDGPALVEYLDSIGELPPGWPRTAKTKALSSEAKHLELLTHPAALAHVAFKRMTREGQYLTKCSDLASLTGRVYPGAKILGAAASGRMSYSAPEVHQFPGVARGCLLAPHESGLTSIDWRSIEPATIANIAGEYAMYEIYESGGDLYIVAMDSAGVIRKVAKVVLLAAMYGEGIAKLAVDLTKAKGERVDVETAEQIQEDVMGTMPAVRDTLYTVKRMAETEGFVTTISGRPLSIPMFFNEKRRRQEYAGYKGQNYVVQGSAYDVLADTIVRGARAGLAGTARIAMHDELVVDTEAAADWRRIMETPPEDMVRAVGRTPKLMTDREDLGVRWLKPE